MRTLEQIQKSDDSVENAQTSSDILDLPPGYKEGFLLSIANNSRIDVGPGAANIWGSIVRQQETRSIEDGAWLVRKMTSTKYYLYLSKTGEFAVDIVAPVFSDEGAAEYHSALQYRYLGSFYTAATSTGGISFSASEHNEVDEIVTDEIRASGASGLTIRDDSNTSALHINAGGAVEVESGSLAVLNAGLVQLTVESTDTGRAIVAFRRDGAQRWAIGVNIDNAGLNDFQVREDGTTLRMVLPDGGAALNFAGAANGSNTSFTIGFASDASLVWGETGDLFTFSKNLAITGVGTIAGMAAVADAPADGNTYGRNNNAWAIAGAGAAHAIGGASHVADTYANLSTKVSDATLVVAGYGTMASMSVAAYGTIGSLSVAGLISGASLTAPQVRTASLSVSGLATIASLSVAGISSGGYGAFSSASVAGLATIASLSVAGYISGGYGIFSSASVPGLATIASLSVAGINSGGYGAFSSASVAGYTTIGSMSVAGLISGASLTAPQIRTASLSVSGLATIASLSVVGLGTFGSVSVSMLTAAAYNLNGVTGVAAQADMETATSSTTIATPGLVHFHPGVAKFWVKAGVAATAVVSYNVTSVTDTGVGIAVINIGTDFSTANYAALVTIETVTTTWPVSLNRICHIRAGTPTASTIGVDCTDFSATTNLIKDPLYWNVIGFGDHA